jgi:septum formation protein
MYETKANLILASASPRRRELLSRVGIKFSVIPSNFEEESLKSCGEVKPELYAQECAKVKAEKVMDLPDSGRDFWFLGVDTIVVIDDLILGKPKSKDEAREFLNRLSGRWHKVITGYYLYHRLKKERVFNVVESRVLIRKMSAEEIEAYINTDEPYDKAGGYAAQGIGAGLIEKIEGSYTNVVGLPLAELLSDMLRLGLIEPCKQG